MRKKAAIALGLLVTAVALAVATNAKRFASGVFDRSPLCSYREAWAAFRDGANRRQFSQQLRAASQRLWEGGDGFDLWQTPRGGWWIPAYESHVLYSLLTEQEHNIYSTGGRGVRPGDIVLDCGAHVGVFTVTALRAGAARVVAIEPGPEALTCLRANLAKEIAAGRVIVYPKGVWSKDDSLILSADDSSAGRSVMRHPRDTRGLIRVPLTTIDKIVAELQLERVDFIKMDIEGAEVPALEGARGTLARFKPRLAIAGYHNRDDAITIPAAVLKAYSGYRFECGPCRGPLANRPEVLFFTPPS